MSNIITKGLKGTFKVILKGFFGFPSAAGEFVRICRLTEKAFVCQKLSTTGFVNEKLQTTGFVNIKLSTTGFVNEKLQATGFVNIKLSTEGGL